MATRRSLAGGAVAALLGTITATVASEGATTMVAPSLGRPSYPDAGILVLCAQLDRLEREYQRIVRSCGTSAAEHAADPLLDQIIEQQQPLLDQICAAPAVTREGMVALASSLLLWDREIYIEEDDPNADTNDRLIAALLRSVLPSGRA